MAEIAMSHGVVERQLFSDDNSVRIISLMAVGDSVCAREYCARVYKYPRTHVQCLKAAACKWVCVCLPF